MPVVLTQSEYMRRMKEMSAIQAGMGFYGEMPDMYSFVLNADHPAVKRIVEELPTDQLNPIEAELKGLNARKQVIEQEQKDKKPEDLTEEEKNTNKECDEAIEAQRTKRTEALKEYAASKPAIAHLIDLALLQNGLLKGEALDRFLRRSVDFVK